MTKLYPTNEMFGALVVPQFDDKSVASIKTDARSFLKSHLDMDVSQELAVVENSDEMVHLALPYYESLAGITAETLIEGEIVDVSGGEILITIGALIGTAIGVAATASIAGGAALVGGIIGCGVAGGAVGLGATAGVVAGAVIGTDEARRQKKDGGK